MTRRPDPAAQATDPALLRHRTTSPRVASRVTAAGCPDTKTTAGLGLQSGGWSAPPQQTVSSIRRSGGGS